MHFSNLSLLHSLSREDVGQSIRGEQLVQNINCHHSCFAAMLRECVYTCVFLLKRNDLQKVLAIMEH